MVISMVNRVGLSIAAKLTLAAIVASVVFAVPIAASIRSASSPRASNGPSCLTMQRVAATPDCLENLAAAQKQWPNAQLKLNESTFAGSGEWLVIDSDGAHFNYLNVSQQLIPLANPIARPKLVESSSGSLLSFLGPTVAFAGVVKSGSGAWSGSCGSQYSYYYRVHFVTWYGANLDLKNSGVINFCRWVTLSEVPSAYNSGYWTNTNGVYYSGAAHSWVHWTGTYWLCCSDAYQEYFNVGMYGNYSWSVED